MGVQNWRCVPAGSLHQPELLLRAIQADAYDRRNPLLATHLFTAQGGVIPDAQPHTSLAAVIGVGLMLNERIGFQVRKSAARLGRPQLLQCC